MLALERTSAYTGHMQVETKLRIDSRYFWHRWFAYLPKKIGLRWVWLEMYWRRRVRLDLERQIIPVDRFDEYDTYYDAWELAVIQDGKMDATTAIEYVSGGYY